MISAVGKRLNIDSLRKFYMSDIYPIFICLLTAIGSISGFAFYFAMLHTVFIFFGLVLSRSIRPTVISLLTFVMQLSVKHSPCYPNNSDYYYTGWRLPAFIAICLTVFCGAVIFIIKNKTYKKISFTNTPILIPLIILGAAFMANGLFSGKWVRGDFIFGFSNMAVYCLVFLLIYHGFTDEEDSRELSRYFAYISMLIGLIIIAELSALFITSDSVIINGAINKDAIALGWGIHNLVGVSLAVLIPAMFYGVHYNRYPWLYFTVATLTYIFAVLTMSRNALLFASAVYIACIIISCFKGNNKRAFRIITVVGLVCIVLGVAAFYNKIHELFKVFFDRGFSGMGRVKLWKHAIKNFLADPIFGGGFYGFDIETDVFGPLAKQAHNTILQLLSATGIVGLFAYAYYRFESLKPVFVRPTMRKTLMAMSIGVLLLGSLLDNFVFNIYPMFHYTVALVIIHKEDREAINI